MAFTYREKLTAVEREIGYRRFVYPRRVANKSMSEKQMNREIAIMEAICDDYKKAVAIEEPDLFGSKKHD